MIKVTFTNTGDTTEVESGKDLKSITKENGWPIAYGCEDGVCGTCIIKVSSGKDNLNEIGDTEGQTLEIMGMNDGEHRLACQCKCNGDVEIEGM